MLKTWYWRIFTNAKQNEEFKFRTQIHVWFYNYLRNKQFIGFKFSFKFSEVIPTKLDAFWRDNKSIIFFLIQIKHAKNKNDQSIHFSGNTINRNRIEQ